MAPSTDTQQAQPKKTGTCIVCGKECELHCSICKTAFYCSQAHQRSDWKAHKLVCRQKKNQKEIAKKKAAHVFVASAQPKFDWDTAPDPPANHPDTRAMQWMHKTWHKLCGYVLTLEVRETFEDCLGFWPTFEAPALLNEAGFCKFCYYASKEEHQGDPPKNYVPMAYLDNPEEWFELERQTDERMRYYANRVKEIRRIQLGDDYNSDEDEDVDQAEEELPFQDKNDRQKAKQVSAAPVVLVRSHTPLVAKNSESPSLLLSLPDAVRARIADFLCPVTWQEFTLISRDTVDWPKPQASFAYSVVCFIISNKFSQAVVGVARTLQDVKAAMEASYDNLVSYDSLSCFWKFVDWDQPIQFALPLLSFEDAKYYESETSLELHEKAKRFLGVVDVGVPNDESGLYDGGYGDWKGEEFGEPVVGEQLGCMLQWMGFHAPRRHLDLRDFAVRKASCTYCGEWRDNRRCSHSETIAGVDRIGGPDKTQSDLWYVPDSPAEERGSIALAEEADDPSWVIFHEEIDLWDM